MEIEKVSGINSNYSAAESVKASSLSAESARAAAAAVEQSAEVEAKTVTAANNEREKGASEDKKEHAPSEATINDAVQRANRKMSNTRCEYSYHKKTNRISIKVFDADTNEVIREIPPEKSLDMLQKMWEMAGILVDDRR